MRAVYDVGGFVEKEGGSVMRIQARVNSKFVRI